MEEDTHEGKAELRILQVPRTRFVPEGFVPQYKLGGHHWTTFSCEATGSDKWFVDLPECRAYMRSMQDDPGGDIVVLHPFEDEEQESEERGPGKKCIKCGCQLLFSARAVGDGHCHICGHRVLAAERTRREVLVSELRAVIYFALDKCVSRTAGNLVNPFAYLRQQDWDDFAAMALKAGVFVLKEEQ